MYLDPKNDTQAIREHLRYLHSTLHNCAKHPYWDIHVPGQEHAANFLDYVGTHLLARDMDLLRECFGAEKMSCYGFSYGTAVCSTYAAQFPDNIGERTTLRYDTACRS